MTEKTVSIRLDDRKQRETFCDFLVETDADFLDALINYSQLLEMYANKIRNLATTLKGHSFKVELDDSRIYLTCNDSLALKLIEKNLAEDEVNIDDWHIINDFDAFTVDKK